jgi:hypothetical protein
MNAFGALARESGWRRDRVFRERLSLWEDQPVKNCVLMEVYRYWESLRPEGLLPRRAAFDLQRLRGVMGMTTLVDVSADNPEDFRFRLVGTMVPIEETLSGRRLGDCGPPEYREALCEDYRSVKALGVPAYHRVQAMLNYLKHSYSRLVLPFADDQRTVSELFVCSVHERFPDRESFFN